MVLYQRDKTGTVFASACCVTALLNTVGYAQSENQRVLPVSPNPPVSEENILRYGEFDVRPHLKIGAMYDDNIFLSSSSEEDDLLWVFTPGVLLGSGDYREQVENYVYLNYEPDFIIFTDNGDYNDIDHDARLQLKRRPGAWTLFFEQDFLTYSGGDVDVGNRLDEMAFITVLNAQYELSPKSSFELGARQEIYDYDGGLLIDGYNHWAFEGWYDYKITPKIMLGGGVVGGILDVQGSNNQTYEQPQVRVNYMLTGKLDVRAAAGVEFRQIDDGNDREDVVASVGATYKPLVNTRLALDLFHRNANSVRLSNQNYRSTGLRFSVGQTISEIYHLYLAGGYEMLDYYGTVSGAGTGREDDYYYVRLGANWDMTDRMNLGVFFQHRDNDSTDNVPATDFSFENNQVGVTFAYRF